MTTFEVMLIISAFLCSLVAGFLFAYAIVIMPGIKNLEDKQFIKAFQITDRVIQNNHPLFIIVWVGSVISLIICALTGFAKLHGLDFALLLLATATYLVGVQISTFVIHLPLNNKLQEYDVEIMSSEDVLQDRSRFETRWNRSNDIRTVIACGVALILIILAFRL